MITLYDIPSLLPSNPAWSPNTLKTRLTLAFKGLPHKTEWVEFPDIAALCKEKGFKATASWKDGSPYYSLPAIIDEQGTAPTAVSESFEIAKYLDATYPETNRVIPEGEAAEEFQKQFALAFRKSVFAPFARIFFPRVATIFNPASKEHFSKGRASLIFNTASLDDIKVTSEEEEAKIWGDYKKGWDEVERTYFAPSDDKGPWVLGDTVSFADFVVVSYLVCFQRVFGHESKEWQELRSLNGGRWGRLFDDTQYLFKVEY
jgi:glutathione S-transferase